MAYTSASASASASGDSRAVEAARAIGMTMTRGIGFASKVMPRTNSEVSSIVNTPSSSTSSILISASPSAFSSATKTKGNEEILGTQSIIAHLVWQFLLERVLGLASSLLSANEREQLAVRRRRQSWY